MRLRLVPALFFILVLASPRTGPHAASSAPPGRGSTDSGSRASLSSDAGSIAWSVSQEAASQELLASPASPGGGSASGSTPITLDVDATEVGRKILHARLTLPISPGPATLYYPKWIPGEHGPTGPITDLAGLRFSAGGKDLPWKRDDAEMYAFHLQIPQGASQLDIALDFLLPPASVEGFSSAASSSSELMTLSWNQVLLYPAGKPVSELPYRTSLKLPPGWKFGTPLKILSSEGGQIGRAHV